MCSMLSVVFGGEECWGEGHTKEDRWRQVLESGCREGEEMRQVWRKIHGEGQQAADWLGEELPQALATLLPGLGDGSVCGATRGHLVEALENIRAKVLAKTLQEVRPQSTRAAWA